MNHAAYIEEQQVEAQDEGEERLHTVAIRFKDGEEIVCAIPFEDWRYSLKSFITIHNPMVVERGANFRVWSEIANTYEFEISTDRIRAMYPVRDSALTKYNKAVTDTYYANLRELLKDPTLPDEEREEIELELLEANDGSEEPEDEKLTLLEVLSPSKLLH